MHDDLIDDFKEILSSIDIINDRIINIKIADDFVSSPYGVTIFDSVSMRLQYIGETLKSINKTNPRLLNIYNEIDWNEIIKFRDMVSHHYRYIDHEIIFNICNDNLADLKKTIEKIIKDLEE